MAMNRRKALMTLTGGAAAVGVLGAGAVQKVCAGAPGKRPAPALNKKGKVYHEPLPYVTLDPDEVQERSYKDKKMGDCMYGVIAAVVEALAEKVGGPYLTYPLTVTRYGGGGVVGWGSTCGAINGAAMAAYLVSPKPHEIIDEVLNFAQYTALPDQRPKSGKMDITPSVAESTLCHVSVSNWCNASGHKSFSKERSERCAQLTANVTRQLVIALNAQHAGTFKAAYPIPAEVKACRACHDKGGEVEDTRGKMSCTTCHDKHEI